ncbi:unnamed protein product [Phyllotreta striolata]|uniref:FAM86 N-terminal domain-containing protein n=1 Tax=Phyllotreta striolata TaxID=444603 RepID=A0A9P0DQC8_PHYSR|nr:unnamed protein product [Phyllotreta striolata]
MNEQKLEKITKQFMCAFPLSLFDWQDIFESILNENEQEELLNRTVKSKLLQKYPIQLNYQKLFLKHVINKLESSQNSLQETVIHDGVYEVYGHLVAAVDSFKNYKHYYLNDCNIITLKESNNLISQGTTGLRTWQASLALSEWIIYNKDQFNEKIVLELGSGIGLTGLVLSKTCEAKQIYLTDCHETVLENLRENTEINLVDTSSTVDNYKFLKVLCTRKNVSVFNLPWEDFDMEICKDLGNIDVVIGADIIYDKDLFQSLLNAMRRLKEFCGVKKFIFSCTERNVETLEGFLHLARQSFQHVEQETIPDQSNFIWPTDTPIRIFTFRD